MQVEQDFRGLWRLERRIIDRMANQEGTLQGTVTLLDQAQGVMDYREEGQFQLGQGPVMQATRSYQWHFGGGWVDVRFADGSPFHRFVPEGCVAGSDHPCGADHYQVRYDFRAWPDWQAVWTVTGPRKDYTSISHYCR
ncbi:DUF6314 family protein [Yoonia sediminilitoris]|uniref:DUF6314 family protein n=1 Tax=Yoonia sediminilitoris TaxID=1286148 RepID=UPI001FEC81A5|nr:DUF6314 family protein [Yoonia sediminilitoris]